MTPCFNILLELSLFLTFTFAFENSQYSFSCGHPSGFFPSNSLLPVNGCKNSVLNWVMKLNLFTQTPSKNFPFYSLIILTLWFRYLQTRSSKIPRKTQEKCISQWLGHLHANKQSDCTCSSQHKSEQSAIKVFNLTNSLGKSFIH